MSIDPQNPNTLYAATVGGIFRTTDGAASWTQMNSGLTAGASYVVVDPKNVGTVYVAGHQSPGGFKRTEGGKKWNAINSGLHLTTVTAVVVDPQNSNTLFANSVSLLKSTDGGKNWTSPNTSLLNTSLFFSLAIDPHLSGAMYMGTAEFGPSPPHSSVF